MTHDRKRYYIMVILAFSFALVGTYLLNADRAISAITFNTILVTIPFTLGFLFIDYTLTLIGRHSLMKYYYIGVLLTYIAIIAADMTQNSAVLLLRNILALLLSIATLSAIVSFFRYAFVSGHEELQADTPHVMNKLADAYQKQKANPKSWEEQSFDFFTSKFGNLSKKNTTNEQEEVSV